MNEAIFLKSSLAIICIYLLWIFGFKQYFLDLYRQRLFLIRDSLFDYALESDIGFNHREYGYLREYINLHIRFAHRMHFLEVFYGWITLFYKKLIKREESQEIPKTVLLIAMLSSIEDENVRKKLLEIKKKADTEILNLLIARNLFLVLFSYLIVMFYGITKDLFRKKVDLNKANTINLAIVNQLAQDYNYQEGYNLKWA